MPDTKEKNANVARAFLSKIYQVLTTKPDIEAQDLPKDNFISWCAPGLPFRKKDFMFASRGLSGDPAPSELSDSESRVSEDDSSGGSGSSGSDSGTSGETESDTGTGAEVSGGALVRRRTLRAAEWSRLTNFIPNRNGIYGENGQKKMFDTNSFEAGGESMPFVYEQVLKRSQVPAQQLNEETKNRLERYRNKLTATVEKENLATGETVEKTVSSDLVKAYDKYMQKYLTAESEYSSKRVAAMTSDDEQVVLDWNLNQDTYRQKVQAAYDKWVSAGYKNEVEQMRAFINQVSMQNMAFMKRDLLDQFDRASITEQNSNIEFLWTSLIPASLPFAEGWQKYSFTHKDVERHSESSYNEWSAGGSTGGLLSIGVSASASGSTERSSLDFDLTNLSISFELAQGIIDRPWFSPEFMLSNAWRFPPELEGLENMTQQLSDGKKPPSGSLIAYPTTALFVRNVEIRFKDIEMDSETVRRKLDTQASVNFGPLRIGGGSYSRGSESYDFEYDVTDNALHVPGMQVIGFRCRVLPKLPNPSDEIENWQGA
jgi:hypothetical protein